MGRRLAYFLDTPLLAGLAAERDLGLAGPGASVRTGILNLYELTHLLLKAGRTEFAGLAYDRVSRLAEGLSRRRIFEASRLRVRLADRGLSYADAAGYVTAREIGALFVTSDRGFLGLPGVRILDA